MSRRNLLINGDCIKVMEKLIEKGQKVDLILTDLPYGTTSCKWDNTIPFEPMWDCINNIVKNENTPILLFGNQPFTSRLINSNIKNFKYCWTWDKHIPSGMSYAKYRPMQQTEDICVFTKNGRKTIGSSRIKSLLLILTFGSVCLRSWRYIR